MDTEEKLAGGDLGLPPKEAIEPLLHEFRALQTETRTINRSTTQAMIVAVGVITLGTALASDHNPQVALLLAPLLLSVVATYQINTSTTSAMLAEYRDRLALVLNQKLGYAVFSERSIQNLMRGSLGTSAAYWVAITISFGAIGFGLQHNLSEPNPWPLLQSVASFISIAAVSMALVDFVRARSQVNRALDKLGFAPWRPINAPTDSSSIAGIIQSTQGRDRDTAQ